MRFLNPSQEIRVSAGREVHLRSLQPLALYSANSVFVCCPTTGWASRFCKQAHGAAEQPQRIATTLLGVPFVRVS
jgi:biotin synthase-like enzyme